jgi:hypothetical protein
VLRGGAITALYASQPSFKVGTLVLVRAIEHSTLLHLHNTRYMHFEVMLSSMAWRAFTVPVLEQSLMAVTTATVSTAALAGSP